MLIVMMTLEHLDKFIQNRIYTEFRGGSAGVGYWGYLSWGSGGV